MLGNGDRFCALEIITISVGIKKGKQYNMICIETHA
jgi:hypothetical protein